MHGRRRSSLLVAVLVAVIGGCASPAPERTPRSPSPEAPTPTASPTPAPTADPTSAVSPTPSVSASPPALAVSPVADGFVAPVGVSSAPGGWLLVSEQRGTVVAVHPERGERATVVDLSDRILAGGERGLLGLVLHPDWPRDGRAWVHYTASDTDGVLAQLGGSQPDGGPPSLDAATERVLLELPDPFPNHNGGQLAFGPDGYLWVGLGDGGSAGDPLGNGQNPATLLGSLLRLDVSPDGGYTVPDDNPFADGRSGAPEVYLTGLRNPWRFSFDPATGLLWIADVGQGAREEIDRLDAAATPGANLGWNRMEGGQCFVAADCSADGLVLPVAEYGHDLGCSVTGGHVYRGSSMPDLAGWYVFADYCTGLLFGVPSDTPGSSGPVAPSILGESGLRISAFGVDAEGELYVVDHGGGGLYRLAVRDG